MGQEQEPKRESKQGQEQGQERRRKARVHRKKKPLIDQHRPVEEERKEPPRRKVRLRWIWQFGATAVALLIVVVAVIILTLSMYTYYTSYIQADLESRAQTAAGVFRNYTESSYLSAARQFVNQFEDKNVIEVQFLTAGGRVLLSSNMVITGASVNSSDVSAAISTQRVQTAISKTENGEDVASAAAPVMYGGTVVGVVRFLTSLREVDRQVLRILAICLAVGAVVVAIVSLFASYLIRSVLDPVLRVTETAKRIAAGSYGVQMEKRTDDEMGELVDAINDMSTQIDQAERAQSEFISSVSHELRTPLTAINGWAETLYNGEVRDAADVKKGMGIIVSEAQRLTRMVEELLEFSRMETGRFSLSVEPIDLQAELEDAVYTYQEFFRRKGLELVYTPCPEELPIISGDPERLRQVFCNLLDNADKHGGSGGRIDVSVEREEEYAVIRIRDYGRGVPEDELPYIKYKFYKGSSNVRGSGIGLAVVDEIVTAHNGVFEVGNAEGGGFVATIRLPLHEDAV